MKKKPSSVRLRLRLRTPELLLIAATAILPVRGADAAKQWEFARNGDFAGWTVSPNGLGTVMGGALWVRLAPRETDPAKIASPRYQVRGDRLYFHEIGTEILSPHGLEIAPQARRQARLKMKILNLSPVTDLYLRWRPKEKAQGWERGDAPAAGLYGRCPLRSNLRTWQEITCYVDGQGQRTVDQIEIYVPQCLHGDIWIQSLALDYGPPKPVPPRPDVASENVVPHIAIPGISQAGFEQAFRVLDRCLVVEVPSYGFTHPFMSPGGYYLQDCWWPMDTSLTLAGAKWANQRFAEGVMLGFQDVQAENPDGRLDLYGGSMTRGQVGDVSQIPRIFEIAYDIARRTGDLRLRGEIYETMRRYLDWWLSPAKRDARTGLISGTCEETQGEPDSWDFPPLSVAPVDLNVAVAVGAARTADLAAALGNGAAATKYRRVFGELSRAINDVLWDERDGVYYNFDLKERRARKRLIVSIFEPMRLGIAPAARRERLLKRMVDPAQFGWGRLPLTSVALADPGYLEAKGKYDGRAWQGDIWTEQNLPIIAALEETGRPDLAAELNWSVIKAFHQNYREYLLPSSGEGQGAVDYGWTASQYIAAIVEHLFGVDFDAIAGKLKIAPHVPSALYGRTLRIDGLILPVGTDTRLSVEIRQSSATTAAIKVTVAGELPKGDLVVALPGTGREHSVAMRRSLAVAFP